VSDNDFGTPDAHDATSVDERSVIESANADASLDKAVKDSLRNRPLGSVKITPEQRQQEYELRRQAAELGDPMPMAKYLLDQKMTREQAVQYFKKMEKNRQ